MESKQARNARPFDVVLWGATGYTGQLVAEYLTRSGPNELRLALAGRSEDKLRRVREELAGLEPRFADLPVVCADSHDRASLDALAAKTRVVCSTVGPYARYGSELVAACVEAGTDYCDLTGEPHWIRRMIDAHHRRATETGARIVCCCGFDSIPSDLGCFLLQQSAKERFDKPCRRVVLYVDRTRGGFSGGTVDSMKNLMEEAERDPWVRKVFADPYALNPEGERQGPDGRDDMGVHRLPDGRWTAPFVMAAVNTRVVRRSNALMGYPYGKDFSYDERMRFPAGPKGLAIATGITGALGAFAAAMALKPTRNLLARTILPKPGQGPTREQREEGMYRIRMEGEGTDARGSSFVMTVRIEGDRDPGYAETAKMLGESALCLALDDLPTKGGLLTPASAMGMTLLERLRKADMTFAVV
jgi:short subunit dehydrogenase-like uncharacterized protein